MRKAPAKPLPTITNGPYINDSIYFNNKSIIQTYYQDFAPAYALNH